MPSTLDIPSLIYFTLRRHPTHDKYLGLQVRQSINNDAVEVFHITPGSPASKTPLKVGYEILSINDHRVRDAQRCCEMLKHYTSKETDKVMEVEIVASAGPRPPGALYVMIKRNVTSFNHGNVAETDDPGDGSFHGLFLEDGSNNKIQNNGGGGGGRVRVAGFGTKGGIFIGSKINKGDILLSIGGRPIHSIDDCHRALKKVQKSDVKRLLIPVLTYNLFRKVRSGIVLETMATAETNTLAGTAKASNPISSAVNSASDNGGGGSKMHELDAKQQPKKRSRCVGDLYAFGPTIGTGGFSVVKKCKSKETGTTYAMKIINRRSMDRSLELALKDEISVLQSLNHPHILRLHDMFATINSYYLVTEYLDGGELFDRIVEKTTYTEKEARDVCAILFGAMQHCHEHGVAHRDLKPENLLLQYKDSDSEIKIADFGFAKKTNHEGEESLTTMCGSPGYVSPEILKRQKYSTKTDMWSIGVIIFILLGGYPPFQKEDREKQFTAIKNGQYKFIEKYWGSVTDEAKSLLRSLLCIDPHERLSAKEALGHPWMRVDRRKLHRSLDSMESLRLFNATRKLKAAVQSVIFMNKMSLTIPSKNADDIKNAIEDDNQNDDKNSDENNRRGSMTAVFSWDARIVCDDNV